MTRTPTPEAMAQKAAELLIPQRRRSARSEEHPAEWALSGWPFFKSLMGRVVTDFRNFPSETAQQPVRPRSADRRRVGRDDARFRSCARQPLATSRIPPSLEAPAACDHISRPVEVSLCRRVEHPCADCSRRCRRRGPAPPRCETILPETTGRCSRRCGISSGPRRRKRCRRCSPRLQDRQASHPVTSETARCPRMLAEDLGV